MNITENDLFGVFNYVVPKNYEKDLIIVDESAIQYNNMYQSYNFYVNKFPDGFDNIPGFDQIIDNIVEKSKNNTPLDEYNQRVGILNDEPENGED